MNQKGKLANMHIAIKILLLVAVLVTIFAGINSLVVCTGRESLVRLVSSNEFSVMQIVYAIMGISSLVTSIFLGIKLFKR
jgi:uncharacterized membrane protein YuzA (DUF378 family)